MWQIKVVQSRYVYMYIYILHERSDLLPLFDTSISNALEFSLSDQTLV